MNDRSDKPNFLKIMHESNILFYPGAGSDISPALRFIGREEIDTIVYCDYLQENIDNVICRFAEERKFGPLEISPLSATDFGFSNREDFVPNCREAKSWSSCRYELTDKQIGFIGRENYNAKPVFFYFNTEAIQTYINLWCIEETISPQMVVIQNHGLGGLWTPLDGDCYMYRASPILPKFLIVGDVNSEPWPGYEKISEEWRDEFSQLNSERSLWRLKSENKLNLDSPLSFHNNNSNNNFRKLLACFKFPDKIRQKASLPVWQADL